MKYLSSIFSFDTLCVSRKQFHTPFISVATAVAIICIGELMAGWIAKRYDGRWQYWSPAAAEKFEHYREICKSGTAPTLLVIGDSTAYRNFDPNEFSVSGQLKDEELWSLAWDGMFALAQQEVTLPLLTSGLRRPATIVVSMSPRGFFVGDRPTPAEVSISNSPICRRNFGDFVLGDWFHLPRVFPVAKYWVAKRSGALDDGLKLNGFGPIEGEFTDKDQDSYSEENLTESRVKLIERLGKFSQSTNVELCFVIPPAFNPTPDLSRIRKLYRQMLIEKSAAFGFQVVSPDELVKFDQNDFLDPSHLNSRGAAKLSRVVKDELDSSK